MRVMKELKLVLTETIMSALLAWIPLKCLETVEPDTHKAYMKIQKVHQTFK